MLEVWQKWRNELAILCDHQIPCCYFPKEANTTFIQLHGFSEASELAYAGAMYLQVEDSNNDMHISLVMAKTRVAPIKHLTIPRLELCGATLLARMLYHIYGIEGQQRNTLNKQTFLLPSTIGQPRSNDSRRQTRPSQLTLLETTSSHFAS